MLSGARKAGFDCITKLIKFITQHFDNTRYYFESCDSLRLLCLSQLIRPDFLSHIVVRVQNTVGTMSYNTMRSMSIKVNSKYTKLTIFPV